MLSLIGFGMMIVFLGLIITKKMSPLTALIIVPVVTALLMGDAPQISRIMQKGLEETSGTGVMIIFSIMYFSLMSDTGLFKPLVSLILKKVKDDPIKVTIGTVIIATVVALDGESSSTYLIVVAALYPLYKKLRLNPLVLICIVTLTCGIMNMLPWAAPAARVVSVLKINTSDLFLPMIPLFVIGLVWVLFVAYFLGTKEVKRLKRGEEEIIYSNDSIISTEDASLERPKYIFINLFLTIALIITIALGILPLPICFMIAFGLALVINYPDFKIQSKIIKRHAGNAVLVSTLIFSAGIFTGILEGTGMIQAMGNDVVSIVPKNLGNFLNPFFALLSLPFTFFFSNDAYYFGILPILNDAGSHLNIPSEYIARSSLIGQSTHLLSPLVPGAYLLCSLVGVEYSDYLKFTLKWAIVLALILFVFSILLGVI